MIDPGKLDQRVTIQTRSQTSDGAGGGYESWSTTATRWAHVKAMSGRERLQADQVEAPRNYKVIMRRDSTTEAITEANRFVWQSKPMNIRFIADEGGREHFIMFECELGVVT